MSGKWWFAGIIFVFFSCKKDKDFSGVQVFGHAGMGLEILNSIYHDNSEEAVDLALSIEGCDGVEVDVQLSLDGELWLYHDPQLQTESSGEGCLPEQTDSYLETVHYNTVQGEKLARLRDLDTNHIKGKTIFLDLRHYSECADQLLDPQDAIDRLEEIGFHETTTFSVYCIISHSSWIQPFITAGYAVIYSIYTMEEFTAAEVAYPEIEGYMIKNSAISEQGVTDIQDSGKKLFIFEVRSPKMIRRALRKRPDGIITDDLRTTLIEKY